VQIAGQPIDANYFDRYGGLVISNEARIGDEGATAALLWYNAYRKKCESSEETAINARGVRKSYGD